MIRRIFDAREENHPIRVEWRADNLLPFLVGRRKGPADKIPWRLLNEEDVTGVLKILKENLSEAIVPLNVMAVYSKLVY